MRRGSSDKDRGAALTRAVKTAPTVGTVPPRTWTIASSPIPPAYMNELRVN